MVTLTAARKARRAAKAAGSYSVSDEVDAAMRGAGVAQNADGSWTACVGYLRRSSPGSTAEQALDRLRGMIAGIIADRRRRQPGRVAN